MRTFIKSNNLNNVTYAIRGPLLREALRMESRGSSIIKLNIGNPAAYGFHAPKWLNDEMYAELGSGSDAYSLSNGLISAREAIADYSARKGIEGVGIDDIFTGNGCSELIITCMQALLSHEDEVLVPAPDYPLWSSAVSLAGGIPVHYICDEKSDWYPDARDIEQRITTKTKAIVLINPNNPTGANYPRLVLENIIR
nr:aminotransferase class I/II-fold pyridoxal phosphate-dependent enzyme [Clostridia bacterium]